MSLNDSNIDVGTLIEEYSNQLVRHCIVRVGDIEDCLDIVQDVFLSLLRLGKVFESERHKLNWMYRVADNKINDHLRKRYTRRHIEVAVDKVIDSAMTIDDDLTQASRLMGHIARLPRKQEVAIRLYYIDGYSTEDIQDFLGVKRQTVWNLLNKARATLKSLLG